MQLDLTPEQLLLSDSVCDVLEAEYGMTSRQASIEHPEGCRPELWQRFVDLGWLMLPLPEESGGLGGNMIDLGIVMQAFGRKLVVEPYLASAVVAGRLLARIRDMQTDCWLARMLNGDGRAVLAHSELDCATPFTMPNCQAMRRSQSNKPDQDNWLLTGFKPLVSGAPGATVLLVSARDEYGQTGLFGVAPDTSGLRLHGCRLSDGSHAADLYLSQVPARRLGNKNGDHLPLVQYALAEAIVALCWEAHGTMRAALNGTAAYTGTRMQFGHPLSQFQVVQHRLGEMLVCCEEALAACQLAALRIDSHPANLEVALDAALMAKNKVGRAARFIAQEAVQLHGAMGVCEELPIAAMFRKLTGFGQQFCSTGLAAAFFGRRQLASGAWRGSQTLIGLSEMSS